MARTLELIGERWTLLIIRDALLHGITRYDDFLARLGAPTTTLARRLSQLVDAGILRREQYTEHPPRFEYHLTARGRDLVVVLAALRAWGDRHLASDGPPLSHVHTGCGGTVVADLACDQCRQPVAIQEVTQVERRPVRRGS